MKKEEKEKCKHPETKVVTHVVRDADHMPVGTINVITCTKCGEVLSVQ